MTLERHPWVRVAEFGSAWEAELAVTRLDAEGIPGRVMGNDVVGIFGPGFMGANARGFSVEVPAPFVSRARYLLSFPAAGDPGASDGADASDEPDEPER